MTDRQRRFCEEYCVDFNATQSAIRAGYSPKTAGSIGHENLRKPEIRAAIDKRLDELSMTAAEATMRLTRWGRGTIEPFLEVDDKGEVNIDLSAEGAKEAYHLIKKIRQIDTIVEGNDGEITIRRRTEIELHDAKDAVIQIAKIRELFKDRVEITGQLRFDGVRFDDA